MALLSMATLALYKFVETRRTAWCVTFFVLLGVLLLTRSLFHLAWMVLVAGVLAALVSEHRKQILLGALAPVLVVSLWYGKNYVHFGSFSASSLMGLGLSNITMMMVPVQDLAPLVQKKELSVWALVSRYENAPAMFRTGQSVPTGIPVLDDITKSNGWLNYNHRDIPTVSGYYTHDALAVIRQFPRALRERACDLQPAVFLAREHEPLLPARESNGSGSGEAGFSTRLCSAHAHGPRYASTPPSLRRNRAVQDRGQLQPLSRVRLVPLDRLRGSDVMERHPER